MTERIKLKSVCDVDAITKEAVRAFDFEFDGTTVFESPRFSVPAEDFGIGLIVGASGSGKSTLLKALGGEDEIQWHRNRTVASHFASAADATERLCGVGLNSIPSWAKPFHVLSTGEKFRANLARALRDGACVDEFTSTVDRNVAAATSRAVSRLIRAKGIKRVVFASCHYDIIEWLEPDWVFDTTTGVFLPRGSLRRRPQIDLEIIPCGVEAWATFSAHHYLTGGINKSSRCWLAVWRNTPVAFMSAIAMSAVPNAWRGHRTVVLPDYQGLGVGVRCSDAIAMMFKADGYRYYSKTAHPRMGEYRERSPLWKPTCKNRVIRKDYYSERVTKEDNYKNAHAERQCYSHEFIGDSA
jgi:ABC-type lipoprotein export system ATPase subunit/GNAT superfamily N-acetyltransferase